MSRALPTPRLFLQACRSNDDLQVCALLQDNPHLVSTVDSDGNTGLMIAAQENNQDIVALLTTSPAEHIINLQNTSGNTAMHLAAQESHMSMATALLVLGANPTLRNIQGHTPLDCFVNDTIRRAALDKFQAVKPDIELPGAPDQPRIAMIRRGLITVMWTAPEHCSPALPDTQYRVQILYRDGTEQPAWQDLGMVSSSTYTAHALAADTDYTFRVAARNAYGWGPFSVPSDVARSAHDAPAPRRSLPSSTGARPAQRTVADPSRPAQQLGASAWTEPRLTAAHHGHPLADVIKSPSSQILAIDWRTLDSVDAVQDLLATLEAAVANGKARLRLLEARQAEETLAKASTCVACVSSNADTVLLPCKHMCLCGPCSAAIRRTSDRCPICRQPIADAITVYQA